MSTMEQLDFSHFLAQELWYQQFVSLDGLNSGVPTRTTATLTPTVLRNIEQTLIDLQCEGESHQNEAGFVPPVVQPISQGGYMNLVETSKGWQGGGITSMVSRPSVLTSVPTIPHTTTPRKNVGGRRPNKNTGISPEEEERRSVRRERNKMAAARCRKRRLDHTNALLAQTDDLEQKKQGLQLEIQQLQSQKEELEFILDAHKTCCRLKDMTGPSSPPDIKPFVLADDKILAEIRLKQEPCPQPPPAKRPNITNAMGGGAKPPRPNSLPVATAFTPSQALKAAMSVSEVAGVPGTTGIPFNFESMMDGGTGLTPVSAPLIPSCSSQQRNSVAGGCVVLSSPDSVPPKLVSL
uniref:(California timema) hypothetical protein n=1 Tax=Timema californicum TaxID=61474 RepID=A0A7R9IVD8_TIMCA|nr:unnamed protein product [Timema californicum]